MEQLQILDFLQSLPIDTRYEQMLLAHLEGSGQQETILVAGDRDSEVYRLLPLEEPLFGADDAPTFPVFAEYGETGSILVLNRDGERERYQTAADFHHFCAGRQEDICSCTVFTPWEPLRRCRLVYVMLNEQPNRLHQEAGTCSGCVMVLSAQAGGLNEDYMDLCGWLREERFISERVVMLLNYRAPFGNKMLLPMAEQLLERKTMGCFDFGSGKRGLLDEKQALEHALLDLQDRSAAGMEDGVLQKVRERTDKKICDALTVCQQTQADSDILARKYESAREAFHAMCVTEQYSLSALLSEEEILSIQDEFKAMFALLKKTFPEMVDEVVSRSKTPKQDLKNLAGDYLSVLTDSFVDQLMTQVAQDLLIPRTQESFLSVCQRFHRMMQDAQLEYTDLESHSQAVFLRMSDINVGDYHPPMVQLVSGLLTGAVKLLLTATMKQFGRAMAIGLEKTLTRFFVAVTDALITKKQYSKSLCASILKDLDEQEQRIYQQLSDTVLPRLIGVLQQEFETLTGVYENQLREKAEEYTTQHTQAQQTAQLLQQKLDQLRGHDFAAG